MGPSIFGDEHRIRATVCLIESASRIRHVTMLTVHDSINLALGHEQAAIAALTALLSDSHRNAPAIPLPPPRPLRRSNGILLGRLLPRSDGTLVLSHGRKNYCQVVFAPPVPLRFRAALVYCSDFRAVHPHNAGTVLEVLSSHVKMLLECSFYSCPAELRACSLANVAALRNRPGKRRDVQARVTAKSPIMGKGQNARFMLEISSASESLEDGAFAVFVVFVGTDALLWWPFLHVGSTYAFFGLKRAKLPDFGDQHVFKVSDDSARIFDVPSRLKSDSNRSGCQVPNSAPRVANETPNRTSFQPPAKRLRRPQTSLSSESQAAHSRSGNRAAFNWSPHAVTYQGVITELLSDGRLRLDDAVYLHLGGDYAWCAGGAKTFVCFRVGARVEALNVLIAFQRGIPTTVFPTARTVVNIVYFGNAPEGGIVQTKEWHRSPWVRYWNHLPAPYILWAQELYDVLPRKFRVWLESTQSLGTSCATSQVSSDLARRLLGSKEEPGLVEYLMAMLTGKNNLFEGCFASTYFYSEFFKWNHSTPSQFDEDLLSFPYPATIAELSAAVDVKWIASTSAMASKDGTIGSAAMTRVLVEAFSEKDLARVLCSPQLSASGKRHSSNDIVLIGMLDGCSDGVGTAQVSDATGSIFVEFVGSLDPSLLGAVIVVQAFQVAVEYFPHTAERKTTFIIQCASIRVLIDGPYVDFAAREANDEPHGTQCRATQPNFPSRNASVRLLVSQNFDIHSLTGSSQVESEVDEYPLVAIFVEMVSSITRHSDGQPRFRVHGHLIAFCQSRAKSDWQVLSLKQENYSRCCLVVHGDAASKIRGSITEGQLYAIGCSDLGDCDDIQALYQNRAEQACKDGRPILLFSASVLNGLWIEQLRGSGDASLVPALSSDHSKEIGNDPRNVMTVEKTSQRFARQFQARATRPVMEILSSRWKAMTVRDIESTARPDSGENFVSMTCMFLCSDTLETQGGGGILPDIRLVFRETATSVLLFYVLFSSANPKPRGLIPGTIVQLRNVMRRGTTGNGSVIFSGCEFTRITRVDDDECPDVKASLCCHRPLLVDQNPFEVFPSCFLWNFCTGALSNSELCHPATCGVVRVNVLELKRIRFFVRHHETGCGSCRGDDGTQWCAGAYATASVEDGTAHGEIECNSFQSVMELLGASQNDSLAIRKELPKWQPSRDVLTNWKTHTRTNTLLTSESMADDALQRISGSFRRSVSMLVRNMKQFNRGSSSSDAAIIEEAQVRGHNVGFGRKLWTAESSKMHQVRLEALAVFNEDFWLSSGNESSGSRHLSVKERYDGYVK